MSILDRFTSQKGKADKAAPKATEQAEKKPLKKAAKAEVAKKEAFKAVPAEPAEKKSAATAVKSVKATGDAHRVLISAIVTEKSARLQKENQYAFMVALDATKKTVADAVQNVFGVQPLAVNMVKLPGKWVRYGRTTGRQIGRKKAIITLPTGKTIDTVST